MSSLHARLFSALLATAMAALAAGCEAGITGTAAGPAVDLQPQGGAPPVVVASADVDTDLVYDPNGPVDDIEGYPYVVYGGVNVYFVEGRWYRHGQGGWGYYRNEPPELGRQREMHDHDARWTRSAAAAQPRTAPERPGVAERQGPERAAPPGATTAPAKVAAEAKRKKAVKKAAPPHVGPTKEPSEKERR